MNSSLSTHYSRSFSGFVWKLIADPHHGLLWIESRDESEMTVQFFKVDVKAAKDHQITLPFDVEWWHHLNTGYGSIIALQKIEDQSNPGSSKLIIANTGDDSIVIEEPEIMIDSVKDGEILYRKTGDSPLLALDLTLHDIEKIQHFSLSIPSVYPEGTPYHETVSDFLTSRGINADGPFCYHEFDSNILISYHLKSTSGISRHVLWLRNGKDVLHRTMDQKMKGYSHESFLLIGDYLVLLFDRKHLEIYTVN